MSQYLFSLSLLFGKTITLPFMGSLLSLGQTEREVSHVVVAKKSFQGKIHSSDDEFHFA